MRTPTRLITPVGGISDESQQFRTPPNANKPPRDGNTHILIVGLDSRLSARDADQRLTMKNWLIDELSANTR